MAHQAFASTPLITPERLRANLAESLSVLPAWVRACGIADPNLPLEENAVTVYVGTKHVVGTTLCPIFTAAVFELTRFGNTVTTNGNGGPDEDMHVRMTFAGHREDNQTLQRLASGIGRHQRAELGPDRLDLRVQNLAIVGDGKALKDARETAIRHAVERARRVGADAAAYETNLRDLFSRHDELHLGAADY